MSSKYLKFQCCLIYNSVAFIYNLVLIHLNESGSRSNNTQNTVLSPLRHFEISFNFREMILLFLLIFAFQNGIASGEVTLEGLNGRLNQLESQVHNLQGEVKVWVFSFQRQIIPKNHKSAFNPYPWFFGSITERHFWEKSKIFTGDVTLKTNKMKIICADRVSVELYYGANFKWHMPI